MRPTKLTPELADKIVDAVRLGNYASVAAQYAGISESTFYRWMERGREATVPEPFEQTVTISRADMDTFHADRIEQVIAEKFGLYDIEVERFQVMAEDTYWSGTVRGEIEFDDRIYREFWERVKAAEAEAEVTAVAAIRQGFKDDWKAAATYLERRHPTKWRRRETVFNEAPPPPDVMETLLADPTARALAAELEERLAGQTVEEELE